MFLTCNKVTAALTPCAGWLVLYAPPSCSFLQTDCKRVDLLGSPHSYDLGTGYVQHRDSRYYFYKVIWRFLKAFGAYKVDLFPVWLLTNI